MAGAAPTTAFGQAVIGPPGSGKTTYCLGMSEFLRALGRRVAVVNLDPANEGLPYECAVDVSELVGLGDVMDALRLGPNGGLLYCMEYLEANLDWLRAKLEPLRGHYFLFDCPGQVELCTHHGALRSIFSQMAQWDLRLTAVHLVDSHYCTDPAKFISVLCTSLATMLHVELPHVNLLSKMDLIEHYGKLGESSCSRQLSTWTTTRRSWTCPTCSTTWLLTLSSATTVSSMRNWCSSLKTTVWSPSSLSTFRTRRVSSGSCRLWIKPMATASGSKNSEAWRP
ncbi:GPN-loop GTPase 2 isoform X3 [Ursus maritimus]|uniref:GPN-loop GTPase 2 n=1 Tax=Ursus maritimus TaxID=29073 RepID=A0A8M1EZ65_URSMA|nr:GPN-loop GTPase 2 isoform X3 [Ursus maritimus]